MQETNLAWGVVFGWRRVCVAIARRTIIIMNCIATDFFDAFLFINNQPTISTPRIILDQTRPNNIYIQFFYHILNGL